VDVFIVYVLPTGFFSDRKKNVSQWIHRGFTTWILPDTSNNLHLLRLCPYRHQQYQCPAPRTFLRRRAAPGTVLWNRTLSSNNMKTCYWTVECTRRSIPDRSVDRNFSGCLPAPCPWHMHAPAPHFFWPASVQDWWSHMSSTSSGVRLQDLSTYVAGREVRDHVWNFKSHVLFCNLTSRQGTSPGALYGTRGSGFSQGEHVSRCSRTD